MDDPQPCASHAHLGGSAPSVPLTVAALPKPGGGIRWITTLAPSNARRYERLVAPWVPALRRAQGPTAFGSITRPDSLGAERSAWSRAVARNVERRRDPWIVVADVRECFSSIDARALGRGLRHAGVPSASTAAIVDLLDAWQRTGARGLPVGPPPSAILSSAVLTLADREVRRTGASLIRWVDDVVIVADDRRSAGRALDAWVGGLRRSGLDAHEGKVRSARGKDAGLACALGAASSIPTATSPSLRRSGAHACHDSGP